MDVGGNVEFLYEDTLDEILSILTNIIGDADRYRTMKMKALKGADQFSYRSIAERSIK